MSMDTLAGQLSASYMRGQWAVSRFRWILHSHPRSESSQGHCGTTDLIHTCTMVGTQVTICSSNTEPNTAFPLDELKPISCEGRGPNWTDPLVNSTGLAEVSGCSHTTPSER